MRKFLEKRVSKKDKQPKSSIISLYKHLTFATILFAALIGISLFLLATEYVDTVIGIFDFFEKADLVKDYVHTSFGSFSIKNIIPLLASLFLYFYFFEYIKKTHVYSLLDDTKESKYLQFLFSIFAFFNYIVFIPILLYLFFIKQVYFEIFVIVIFWIVTKSLFIKLLLIYKTILFNYNLLIQFNWKQRKLAGSKVKKAYFSLLKSKNQWTELRNFSEKNAEQVADHTIKQIILLIFNQKAMFLKSVMFISLFSAIISIALDFNILSIIYLQLHFLMWYFVLSAILGIPITLHNIFLVNENVISDVYIIEDSPRGHIITLDSQNKIKKIMKSSIVLIENK